MAEGASAVDLVSEIRSSERVRFPVTRGRRENAKIKRGRFTEEQIIGILPDVEAGATDREVCRRRRIEHQLGASVIIHPAFGEQQDPGAAVFVHDGMEFGVQAAFRASDSAGYVPFLGRPAAVPCASKCVVSIINCSGVPRSPARDAKTRAKTPKRLYRTKR